MRAFYERSLWITKSFSSRNRDLHHRLLSTFLRASFIPIRFRRSGADRLTMAQRVQDQLDAARNSQSIEDPVKLVAHRVLGDMKRLGDITVRHSFSQ